jgi:excisionase family DNA binding protein
MAMKAFTTRQVALLAHVSQSTIANWISAGLLPAFRTPGGHHRIMPGDFVRFLETHGFPVPEELAAELKLRVLIVAPAEPTPFVENLKAANANLEISTAGSSVEGLLRVGLDRPDVLFWAVGMNDLSSAEVLKQVVSKPETQALRVCVLAAPKDPNAQTLAKQLGARLVANTATAQDLRQILQALRDPKPRREKVKKEKAQVAS